MAEGRANGRARHQACSHPIMGYAELAKVEEVGPAARAAREEPRVEASTKTPPRVRVPPSPLIFPWSIGDHRAEQHGCIRLRRNTNCGQHDRHRKQRDHFHRGLPKLDAVFGCAAKGEKRETNFLAQEVEPAARRCDFDFSGVIEPANEHSKYMLSYVELVVPPGERRPGAATPDRRASQHGRPHWKRAPSDCPSTEPAYSAPRTGNPR